MDKKGQLGLDTVKAVMIAFLVLAVLGVTILLLNTNLKDVSDDIYTETITMAGDSVTDGAVIPASLGTIYIENTAGYRNCIATVTAATHDNGSAIAPGNYTVSGCTVAFASNKAGDVGYNNSVYNLTGSYTYNPADTAYITDNVSAGTSDFFSNTSTVFNIIVVVVIILAISIIIISVQRFTGGRSGL